MSGPSRLRRVSIARGAWALRAVQRLVTVGGYQLVVQGLGGISALLLFRWLGTAAVAQFTLVVAFAGAMTVIADSGLSGAVPALIGDRVDDPAVVLAYASAARDLRTMVAVALSLPVAIAFYYTAAPHHWSFVTMTALLLLVIVSVGSRVSFDAASVPYVLSGDLRALQMPQALGQALRLVAQWMLHVSRLLTSVTATLVMLFASVGVNFHLARASLLHSVRATGTERSELLAYIRPQVLVGVYYALQGQIAVFILSAAGGTASLADIGALTRLMIVFSVVGTALSLLLTPRAARVAHESLPKWFLATTLGATATGALIVVAAAVAPSAFLAVLGRSYEHLDTELVIAMATGAVSMAATAIHTTNSVRGFVYWRTNVENVVLSIGGQLGLGLGLDLSSLRGALWFGLGSVAIGFLVSVRTARVGIRRQSRAVRVRAAS